MIGSPSPHELPQDLPFIIPFGEAYPQIDEKEREAVALQFKNLVDDSLVKYLGGVTFPDLLPAEFEPYTLTELYLRTSEADTDWTVWLGAGIASPKHPRNKSGENQPYSFLALKNNGHEHQYLMDVGSSGVVIRNDGKSAEEAQQERDAAFEDYRQQLIIEGHAEQDIKEIIDSLTMRERLDILREWGNKKYEFDIQMGLNHQPICRQELHGLQAYVESQEFEAFTPPEPEFEEL